MKKILLIMCLFGGVITLRAQQDPQYNLYQFNQLVINPAYAGARDALQVIAAHREQWLGFPGAPRTTCFSIHSPFLDKKLGAGLTLVKDEIGPRNVISAYGNVAYIMKLTQKLKLSFGVNAGYNRYQFNFTDVKFYNSEVPAELYQNITPGTLDINSGLFLRSSSFFVGVSATHLNSPNVYTYEPVTPGSGKFTYRLSSHLFVMAGQSFVLNDKTIFAPTVLFKHVGGVNAVDLNMNFLLFRKLWLGAFYRHNYGIGGLFQYFITDRFKVGYSYDTGMQGAGRLGASHEIMVGFDFVPTKSQFINPRFL